MKRGREGRGRREGAGRGGRQKGRRGADFVKRL